MKVSIKFEPVDKKVTIEVFEIHLVRKRGKEMKIRKRSRIELIDKKLKKQILICIGAMFIKKNMQLRIDKKISAN